MAHQYVSSDGVVVWADDYPASNWARLPEGPDGIEGIAQEDGVYQGVLDRLGLPVLVPISWDATRLAWCRGEGEIRTLLEYEAELQGLANRTGEDVELHQRVCGDGVRTAEYVSFIEPEEEEG